MTKRNHRAASLKAWRTRRKMKQARAEFGPEYLELIDAIGKTKERERRDYRRVLPCPDFGSVR